MGDLRSEVPLEGLEASAQLIKLLVARYAKMKGGVSRANRLKEREKGEGDDGGGCLPAVGGVGETNAGSGLSVGMGGNYEANPKR